MGLKVSVPAEFLLIKKYGNWYDCASISPVLRNETAFTCRTISKLLLLLD